MADQTLTLKLTADGSGLTATLESATGGVRKFTTGMKDAERQTGDSGAKIESTFAGIKDSLGDIAAAVGLAFSVDKITGWVRGAIEGASRIQNLSQTLGIGTQTLQAMSYAAGLTDTSLDSLAGTLSRLERASLEARDGNVQTAAAFTAVGISVEQIRKLSPDQLFEATAKGISQLQDGSTKTAVTMQLMGRGAAENIPFINKMGNELEGLKDKAAQVGVVLSGVDQAALAAFSDRTNELGQDVKGLSNQLAIALLPALTSVVGQLQRAAENDDGENDGEHQRRAAGVNRSVVAMHEAVREDAKKEGRIDARRVNRRRLVAEQHAGETEDESREDAGDRAIGEIAFAERNERKHAEADGQRHGDERGHQPALDVAAQVHEPALH